MKKKVLSSFASLIGIGVSAEKSEAEEKPVLEEVESEEPKEESSEGDAATSTETSNEESSESSEDTVEETVKEDKPSAILVERSRCAKIIAHGIKMGKVEMAGVFAFDTDMTAEAAITAITAGSSFDIATAKSSEGSLASRMAKLALPVVKSESAASSDVPDSTKLAAQIVAAGKKARGEI
ncbi:MAG TPA: hypothetical protein VFM18_08505 [Methanosarcina sp.]|nr:hypothetical protein [Methanosarcina sp.]